MSAFRRMWEDVVKQEAGNVSHKEISLQWLKFWEDRVRQDEWRRSHVDMGWDVMGIGSIGGGLGGFGGGPRPPADPVVEAEPEAQAPPQREWEELTLWLINNQKSNMQDLAAALLKAFSISRR